MSKNNKANLKKIFGAFNEKNKPTKDVKHPVNGKNTSYLPKGRNNTFNPKNK